VRRWPQPAGLGLGGRQGRSVDTNSHLPGAFKPARGPITSGTASSLAVSVRLTFSRERSPACACPATGDGRMPLGVSDGFTVRPQLILTEVDVVILGDAIPPGVDVYRSKEGRDAEQTCWPDRPDRVDSG
jgi:hypothetical protein